MKGRFVITSGRRAGARCGAVLLVSLLCSQTAFAAVPCVWSGVEKIVAIGDLHGDYEDFLAILKGTKIVDDELHWIAGKTHLVQLGDILDRGFYARKIFDLLMSLEKEAEEAGGRVHALIGNHEMMNLSGIVFDYSGYMTPEQFVSFVSQDFRRRKEKSFAKHVAKKDVREIDIDLMQNSDLRAYWLGVIKNDPETREAYHKGFMSVYGKWILRHNAVIKINDVVFVHGGISPAYASMRLEDINARVRSELDDLSGFRANNNRRYHQPIVFERDGPLWYRDLAFGDEREIKNDVDKVLAALKADYMVIAHSYRAGSPVSLEFMTRFQGRVWTLDTGISEGNPSALIIENGNFSVWGDRNEQQDGMRLSLLVPGFTWARQ